jgi:hypothetical protein
MNQLPFNVLYTSYNRNIDGFTQGWGMTMSGRRRFEMYIMKELEIGSVVVRGVVKRGKQGKKSVRSGTPVIPRDEYNSITFLLLLH